MRIRTFAIGLLAILAVGAQAADSAQSLMDAARKKAASEKKNVMVIFHASWCGWCHRLDDFMNKSPEGNLVRDSLVVVHITVMERGAEAKNMNPGGEELMKSLGGEGAGLPFYAIQSPAGKLILNSLAKGKDEKPTNIGYPAAPEEIAHFMRMLKLGTKLKADQFASIEKWLTTNKPK